jgi:hypothetical protein
VSHSPSRRPSARELCVEGIRNGFTHDFLPKNLITFIRQARLKDMLDYSKKHPVFGLYPGCVKEVNNNNATHFLNGPHVNYATNYHATHVPLLEYATMASKPVDDSDRIQLLNGSFYDSDIYEESSSSRTTTSTLTSENNIFLKASCGQISGSSPMLNEVRDSFDAMELGEGRATKRNAPHVAPLPSTTQASSTATRHRKVREYLSPRHDAESAFLTQRVASSSESEGITSVNSPGVLGVDDEFANNMSISNTWSEAVLIASEDRMHEDTNSLREYAHENALQFPCSPDYPPGYGIGSLASSPSISITTSSSSSYLKVESVSESNEETYDDIATTTLIGVNNSAEKEEELLAPFLSHAYFSVSKGVLGMQLSEEVLEYIISLEQTITRQKNYIQELEAKNEKLEMDYAHRNK